MLRFKWLFTLWLCFFCATSFFSTSGFAAKKIDVAKDQVNAKNELSDLHEKIQALKKELDSNQAAHKDATDELKSSETAISSANKKLHDINQKQKKNKNKLNTLKKQSLNLNENLSQQQQQLSKLLRQQYMHGGHTYSQLILQNKNPSDISRDVKYFSYIAKQHAKVIDGMQTNLVKVKKLNNQTATTLQEVADLKAKQEVEKKELEQQKHEKSTIVKTLSKQISAQHNEIDKLKRDEKSLSNLVERLAKIIPKTILKKTKKTIKKKQDKIDDGYDEKIARNEATPTNAYSGSNFAALKGKLHLPVRGDVTNRFGAARKDTGVTWKGLFIKASEGNDVKTVADGRVVFVDWMRGFGNMIIVDHGNGYMSLYGNNQAVLKSVGDEVNAGDAIASVGNSGGNESNGLYYELRRQSKPFDPMSWSVIR